MNYSTTMTVVDNEIAPRQTGVQFIGLADLRAKLSRQDDFVFVMAMDRRRFDSAHIGGSISFDALIERLPYLSRDSEIVLYCTGPECAASKLRAAFLVDAGFSSVSRFAGGLAEWSRAGLPLA